MASLVGALTLARAVRGTPLSDEILEAARSELLALAACVKRSSGLFPKCS